MALWIADLNIVSADLACHADGIVDLDLEDVGHEVAPLVLVVAMGLDLGTKSLDLSICEKLFKDW